MSSPPALVVDDNGRNLDVLAHLLERQGFGVIRVADPTTVDAALQGVARVDVAFVDLEMPNVDGYTVLRALKADGRFQGVPIVAYTVHVSEMDVAYNQGFDGFLSKPLDAQRFPELLAMILSGKPVWVR